jgi:glutamate-1-semialdehyde 2,1-aminomutase
MTTKVNGENGSQLWQRADTVIPQGGIFFTRSARFAGKDVLPGFIKKAHGCYVVDVDGKSYIDFNCGNGPNLLGYCHPEIDSAAAKQASEMDLASFFPEAMVDYAEQLVSWSETFDWTVLVKNGSDATNLALRIMRAARQQPLIVLFESAYHGFGAELALRPENPSDDAQKNILRVPWNDAKALDALAQSHGKKIAGLMLNPLDQNPLQETQYASAEFLDAIERFRKSTGALLTIDDVRAGFRLHEKGSHRFLGIQPDLLCLGKALANGYATSALLGVNSVRDAAESVQLTATYMFSAVAFRAGIATLDFYEHHQVFNHIQAMGEKLVTGLKLAAIDAGHIDVIVSGPVTMPSLLFAKDSKLKRARTFAREAALNGAIFHPTLNWFLNFAHKPEHIDEAIEIAKIAFSKTPTRI